MNNLSVYKFEIQCIYYISYNDIQIFGIHCWETSGTYVKKIESEILTLKKKNWLIKKKYSIFSLSDQFKFDLLVYNTVENWDWKFN